MRPTAVCPQSHVPTGGRHSQVPWSLVSGALVAYGLVVGQRRGRLERGRARRLNSRLSLRFPVPWRDMSVTMQGKRGKMVRWIRSETTRRLVSAGSRSEAKWRVSTDVALNTDGEGVVWVTRTQLEGRE